MDAYELSIAGAPMPFKSGTHVSETNSRRSRSLKQIINHERDEKLQRLGIDTKGKKRTATPKRQRTDSAQETTPEHTDDVVIEEAAPERQVPTCASLLTDTTVEAPPSLMPRKKYCDVTGLKGLYTDPKSRLFYHSKEVYEIIKGFVRAALTRDPGRTTHTLRCVATQHNYCRLDKTFLVSLSQ